TGQRSPLASLALAGDGKSVVVGLQDGGIASWAEGSGWRESPLDPGRKPATAIACLAKNRLVASLSEDSIRFWQWPSLEPLETIGFAPAESPTSLALAPDGQGLVVGTKAGTLLRFELAPAPRK